jgi:hypothetical protein
VTRTLDDPWDRAESEVVSASIPEEIGKLLDERAAALARTPTQRKYTLEEIAARHNVRL